MTVNQHYYILSNKTAAYLEARGFDQQGNRSGGIVAPKLVTVPAGTIMVRTYSQADEFGQWWLTAHELHRLLRHSGRATFAEGRPAAKGMIHGALALKEAWNNAQLFICAAPTEDLTAYYGLGDDAADATSTLKVAKIIGAHGTQTRVRQLYFAKCWEYAALFRRIAHGWTDSALANSVRGQDKGAVNFELPMN